MTGAQSQQVRQVLHRNLRSKIVLYVLESPLRLPSRETTRPQNTLQWRRINANCSGFSAEE